MLYRKDIQILRGISVLLVVLFHLELGGWKSGFLGVDVFFVLSGFLMAVLYDEKDILGFFSRRGKRLLPAYFVTILATLLFTILLTTPVESNSVNQQSIFGVFFVSNIGFWLENSYFSKAEFKPLLHLWSLGVEVQYYLLVPFLFFVIRKFKGLLYLMIAVSLIACFTVLTISPKTSFFMLPFRLWEFLIGYAAASVFTNAGVIKYKSSFTWLGFIALLTIMAIPLMAVDGNSLNIYQGHPGIFSLLVTLSTFFVLIFGLPQRFIKSSISSVLEVLGKYSYSIYLVHFPIIVLFLYTPFNGTIMSTDDPIKTVQLIGLIIVASVLMHHLIEKPKLLKCSLPKYVFFPITITLVIIGGTYYQTIKFPPQELAIFNAWTDRDSYRCGKIVRIIHPGSVSCNLNKVEVGNGILLVGNSHADSIKSSFLDIAIEKNVDLWFLVDNRPLMARGMSPELLIQEAKLRNNKLIVLHFSPGSIKSNVIEKVILLSKDNGINVSFVMPVPVWKEHIPKVLFNHLRDGVALPQQTSVGYDSKNRDLIQQLLVLEANYSNFKVIPLVDLFCNPSCQIVTDEGKPLYFDDTHLTLTGSRLLSGTFEMLITESMP